MHPDRITHVINNRYNDGKYVLYWMQQSCRVSFNHALLHAIEIANHEQLPLLVIFTVTDDYLGANLRHYQLMLEGLNEVAIKLQSMGISFAIIKGEPSTRLASYIEDAHSVIMDVGYLHIQTKWRRDIIDYMQTLKSKRGLYLVESDVIVPVKKAYNKLAYGAYVLRPHIMNKIALYRDFKGFPPLINQQRIAIENEFDLKDIPGQINTLKIDHTIRPYDRFKGGYQNAINHLEDFVKHKMDHYLLRSDPALQIQSYMSIYLHFGQISALEIYEYVTELFELGEIQAADYDAFIEQLVVRRELAFNFVVYNKQYDQFHHMTEPWAYQTMQVHHADIRLFELTLEEIEQGKTHDIYFNAAMKEMRITGFMANYMRMYWAKKIMEWSPSMEEAYQRIVYLNNKYFLDGRDANSYVNIAWCFGKMDRAFYERAIFGKLRYMNDSGLKRKFMIDDYIDYVRQLGGE